MRLAIVDDRVTAAVGDDPENPDVDPDAEAPDDADAPAEEPDVPVEADGDLIRWVLAVEGTPTGDGRIFAPGALTFAEFPFPLMATDKTGVAHDGAQLVGHFVKGGMEGTEAVAYSRMIESDDADVINLQRLIDAGDMPGISVDLDDVEGEFIISAESALAPDVDPDADIVIPFGGDAEVTTITKGRIRAATAVPIPAFVEAKQVPDAIAASLSTGRVTLIRRRSLTAASDGSGVVLVAAPANPADYTVEGGLPAEEMHVTLAYYGKDATPETVEALKAYVDAVGDLSFTANIGGVVRLGDDDPQAVALLVEATEFEDLAAGAAEAAEPSGGHPHFVPHMTLGYGVPIPDQAATPSDVTFAAVELWVGTERYVAAGTDDRPAEDDTDASDAVVAAIAAPDAPPAEWFDNPGLTGPTPMTVTDEGRVFGHLATWDACHIGFQNECVMAPRSLCDYGAFTTGFVVCADGSRRRVGQITTGSGHAGMSATARLAKEHYDHTGWSAADVAIGEDRHGVYVAGAMRPGLTTASVREFTAADISGDWRRVDGNLELVGIASVNVPGFQKSPALQARVASGTVQSMVATAHRDCDDLTPAVDRSIADRIALSIGRHPVQLAAERDMIAERIGRGRTARREQLAARMGR